MGKRDNGKFERVNRGFYPSPWEAVVPLTHFLHDVDGFAEPCAGNGALIRHLERLGHKCFWSCDLQPSFEAMAEFGTFEGDALALTSDDMATWGISHFITNPPWPLPRAKGQPTLDIIRTLASIKPTWLLLAADFKHNSYAPEVMAYCRAVVSIGRVRWIEGSSHDGFENCAWYLFDANDPGPTIFYARTSRSHSYEASIEALL